MSPVALADCRKGAHDGGRITWDARPEAAPYWRDKAQSTPRCRMANPPALMPPPTASASDWGAVQAKSKRRETLIPARIDRRSVNIRVSAGAVRRCFDRVPYLSGNAPKSPRKGSCYFSGDGDQTGLRCEPRQGL